MSYWGLPWPSYWRQAVRPGGQQGTTGLSAKEAPGRREVSLTILQDMGVKHKLVSTMMQVLALGTTKAADVIV